MAEVSSFWEAVAGGDVLKLKTVLEEGKIDVLNIVVSGKGLEGYVFGSLEADWGRSALQVASGKGHLDLVRFLLERGAGVDSQDEYGKSALMLASGCGHCDVVKLLLDNGASIDQQDSSGKSALVLASENGYSEMVELLLDKGAQVDVWKSAMVLASNHGNWEFWKLLLERKYPVDNFELSPLMSTLVLKYEGCLETMFYLDYPCQFEFVLTASHLDYLEEAQRLLDSGAQIVVSKLKSLFWLACIGGNFQIAMAIIGRHPWSSDESAVLWGGGLVLACVHGRYETVKLLLETCFPGELVKYGKFSDASLIGACKGGQYEVVKLLIERGASVNAEDSKGRSALMTASYSAQYAIVKLLLEYGAALQVDLFTYATKDFELFRLFLDGYPSLEHYAHDMVDVEVLLESCPREDRLNDDGYSPLMFAIKHGFCEIVQLLLERGAQVDLQDSLEWTALIFASEHGHYEIARLLLDKGAQVDLQDNRSMTALMVASEHGHCEMAKLLLDRGAQVNLQDKLGRSAVVLASDCGHWKLGELLLERGAQVDSNDPFASLSLLVLRHHDCLVKSEAIQIACLKEAEQLLQKISDAQGSTLSFPDTISRLFLGRKLLVYHLHRFMCLACIWGHYRTVKLMLEMKWPYQGKHYYSLTYAMKHGHSEIVELYLDSCAQEDLLGYDGHSPLMFALEHGLCNMAKLLLDKGAQVNLQDKLGRSALMLASEHRHCEMAKLLLDKGAQVDQQDTDGKSALMFASELGHCDVARGLLDKGAQVDLQDKLGRSAAVFAGCFGHWALGELLLERGASVDSSDPLSSLSLLVLEYRRYLTVPITIHAASLIYDKADRLLCKIPEVFDTQGLFRLLDEDINIGLERLLISHLCEYGIMCLVCIWGHYRTAYLESVRSFDACRWYRTMLEFFLESCAREGLLGYKGCSSLLFASKFGSCDLVRLLLDRGAQVNLRDSYGRSALMFAGKHEVAKLLLDKGAQVDLQDSHDRSALMLASENGHYEIAKLLLDRGAQVNLQDKFGRSAVVLASDCGHWKLGELLLERGAQVDNNDPSTCLSVLLLKEDAVTMHMPSLTKYLEEAEENVVRHMPSLTKYLEEAEQLLQKGAQINLLGDGSKMLLRLACASGNLTICKAFLQAPLIARVDHCKTWFKAINTACIQGHDKVVELILDRGFPQGHYITLVTNGMEHGHYKVVEVLLERCAQEDLHYQGISPLLFASKHGLYEMAKLLLDWGAQVNLQDSRGRYALMFASGNGKWELTQLLLDKGAQVDLQDSHGRSALMLASENGHYEIAKLLLDRGAQVNLQDKFGRSAVLFAGYSGHWALGIQLLKRGAQVDNNDPSACLSRLLLENHVVVLLSMPSLRAKYLEEAEQLLQKGAQISLLGDGSKMLLRLACASGNLTVCKAILKAPLIVRVDHCKSWFNAINTACIQGHSEIVELMLDRGFPQGPYFTLVTNGMEHGHCKVVEVLLERCAQEDLLDHGFSPLMFASKHGLCEMAKLLLDWGAQVNLQDSRGRYALLFASGNGECEIAKLLLDEGAQVDLQDTNGRSALMIASEYGYCEIAQLLLDKGAWVNLQDSHDRSALMIASEHGHCEMAKLLLDKGAQVDLQDTDGKFALILAIEHGHCDVVELLLDTRFPENLKQYIYGNAFTGFIFSACNRGHKEIVGLLLERGAKADAELDGRSAVQAAIDGGHHEIVKLLLEGGAKIDVAAASALLSALMAKALLQYKKHRLGEVETIDSPYSLLGEAIIYLKLIELLLDKGAQINFADEDGCRTLLLFACTVGSLQISQSLLACSSWVNAMDRTAFWCGALVPACSYGHYKIVELLLENAFPSDLVHYNAADTPLLRACEWGHFEVVKLLLKKGANINAAGQIAKFVQDQTERSALMIASANGHYQIVELLVEQGADIDMCNAKAETALTYAVREQRAGVVRVLLHKGARVGLHSALTSAMKHGHYEVVVLFLDSCAQENLLDDDGCSPLMFASEHGLCEMAKLLLDKGAQVDLQDSQGRSALMLAMEHGFCKVAVLLLQHKSQVDIQDGGGRSALSSLYKHWCQKVNDLLYQFSAMNFSFKPEYAELTNLVLDNYVHMNLDDQESCQALLIFACAKGNLEISQAIIAKFPNWIPLCGNALLLACAYGRHQIVELLLREGLPQDLLQYGKYSLLVACQRAHHKVVKVLLEKGADVDAVDDEGRSGLIVACDGGHYEIAKLLLDKGCRVDQQDRFSKSSLMYASEDGYQDVVELLLQRGAQVDLEDDMGRSAQRLARRNKDVLRLLDNHTEIHEQAQHQDKESLVATTASSSDEELTDEDGHQSEELEHDPQENEFIQGVKEAIANSGEIDRKHAHSTFVGPPGSGKSSLMVRLLGRLRKEQSPSTGVCDSVVVVDIDIDNPSTFHSVTVVDPNTWKEVEWKEVEYDSSLVRQMSMVNLVTSQQEKDQHQPPFVSINPLTLSTACSSSESGAIQHSQLHDSDAEASSIKPSVSPKLSLKESSASGIRIISENPGRGISDSDIEAMISAVFKKYGGYKEFKNFFTNSYTLYLRDTGGQVEFQEMIALLIFGPSIFFFVFRADRDFQSKFSIEYRTSGSESTNCYTSSVTSEEALLQCLASVYAMDTSGKAGVKTHKPLVFIVGTHKDMLGPAADEKIAELNKVLDALITRSGFNDLVQYANREKGQIMFAVDNTSESDEDFKLIRSQVHNLVSGRQEFTVKYPISYLMFCLELQNLKRSILSLDECKAIAAQYGIVGDQMSHLLQFLHLRIGVIQYFDVDGLRHIVIKEPQILFNKVTNLVIETFSSKALKTSEQKDFEKGVFTAFVFENVIKFKDEISCRDFLKLLVHLRIITPFPSTTPRDQEERYFIPCVLNHVQESSKNRLPTNILPLSVRFQCSHCPKGLFGVLVTHLMTPESAESQTSFTLIQDKIYKDQVSFKVHALADEDEISLKMFPSHLDINFFPAMYENEDRDLSLGEVCNKVREVIETSILLSLRDLHYNERNVKPVTCFRCGHCSELHQVKRGKKYCKLFCDKANTNSRIPLQGRFWYDEATNASTSYQLSHQITAASPASPATKLSALDITQITVQLTPYSQKWKGIGQALRFTADELSKIEAQHALFVSGSDGYLSTMLSAWGHWAPGDARGSTNYATLESLRRAVDGTGLGDVAKGLHV